MITKCYLSPGPCGFVGSGFGRDGTDKRSWKDDQSHCVRGDWVPWMLSLAICHPQQAGATRQGREHTVWNCLCSWYLSGVAQWAYSLHPHKGEQSWTLPFGTFHRYLVDCLDDPLKCCFLLFLAVCSGSEGFMWCHLSLFSANSIKTNIGMFYNFACSLKYIL